MTGEEEIDVRGDCDDNGEREDGGEGTNEERGEWENEVNG